MRFKQYLIEEIDIMIYEDYLNNIKFNNVYFYLMEMKVNDVDNDIKKINSYLYEFTVNDITYQFNIDEIEALPGYTMHSISFHPKNKISFTRLDKHTMVQVRKVFEKVITCMIMFIGEHKPERFTFTGHDYKLYKTYKLIIERIRKTKNFKDYKMYSDGRGFTFERLT